MSTAGSASAHDTHHGLMVNNKKLFMAVSGFRLHVLRHLISTHLIYRKLLQRVVYISLAWKHLILNLHSVDEFIPHGASVSTMHKGELKSFRRNVCGVIFFGLIFLGSQVYEFTNLFTKA